MFLDRFRRLPFARALEDYGLDRCSVSPSDTGPTIWIGLPVRTGYDRVPLQNLPEAPRTLNFAEAPLQADLIGALARSREAATLEHLFIGTSHDYAWKLGTGTIGGFDMTASVAALAGGHFPALRWLSLGDMELLYNGHRVLGRIGDVTHVFPLAPRMQELKLHGQFGLGQPVRHEALRRIEVELDDIGVSGGPLSQATVTHLLSSRFPVLASLSLNLDEQDMAADYDVPEAFLRGDGMPALAAMAMDSLTPGAHARLLDWAAARGLDPGSLTRGALS